MKVGILSPGKREDTVCLPNNQGGEVGCFIEAFRTLVHNDGQNVAVNYLFAEGAPEPLPGLAVQLVRLRPDVIYTFTSVGAVAATEATTTIPIVVGPAGESTFERLAGNFNRPVGNVTGFTLSSSEQEQKCLQLLKELAPGTSRVAVLSNPTNPGSRKYLGVLLPGANQLGITLTKIEARNASDLPQAFALIKDSCRCNPHAR